MRILRHDLQTDCGVTWALRDHLRWVSLFAHCCGPWPRPLVTRGPQSVGSTFNSIVGSNTRKACRSRLIGLGD